MKLYFQGYPNPPAPIPLSLQVNENQYFRENNVRVRNQTDLILEPEQLIAPSLPGASTSVLSLKPYYNEPPPPYSLMENTSNERTTNSNSQNIHNQLPVYDQLPGAMGAPINYFPYVQDPNCVLPQKR